MKFSHLISPTIAVAALIGLSSMSAVAATAPSKTTTATPSMNSYYSTFHKRGHKLPNKAETELGRGPATSITVVNDTGVTIYMNVPAGGFTDQIPPGQYANVDNVYNNSYAGNTRLKFYNNYQAPIWSNSVWNHAVLEANMINGQVTITQVAM